VNLQFQACSTGAPATVCTSVATTLRAKKTAIGMFSACYFFLLAQGNDKDFFLSFQTARETKAEDLGIIARNSLVSRLIKQGMSIEDRSRRNL